MRQITSINNFFFICLFFLTGNGLGIRVVGGKEVPRSNGEIGAYVAKVLPGGAAEQTGKILEGNLLLCFLIMNFGQAKNQLFGKLSEPHLAGTGGTTPWRE